MEFIDEKALLRFASASSEREARRATAVLLDAKKIPRTKIAKDLGCSYGSVWRWAGLYAKHGVEGLRTLATKRGSGCTSCFSDEQRRAICELVVSGASSHEEPYWTIERITKHVVRSGITDEISTTSVRSFLLAAGIDWRDY